MRRTVAGNSKQCVRRCGRMCRVGERWTVSQYRRRLTGIPRGVGQFARKMPRGCNNQTNTPVPTSVLSIGCRKFRHGTASSSASAVAASVAPSVRRVSISQTSAAMRQRRPTSAIRSPTVKPGRSPHLAYPMQTGVTDYSWRSLERMTVVGKLVVTRYYARGTAPVVLAGMLDGRPPGPRDGTTLPDYYDAIIAGAPVYTSRLQLRGIANNNNFYGEPGRSITPDHRTTINNAVLAACDETRWSGRRVPDRIRASASGIPRSCCAGARRMQRYLTSSRD